MDLRGLDSCCIVTYVYATRLMVRLFLGYGARCSSRERQRGRLDRAENQYVAYETVIVIPLRKNFTANFHGLANFLCQV